MRQIENRTRVSQESQRDLFEQWLDDQVGREEKRLEKWDGLPEAGPSMIGDMSRREPEPNTEVASCLVSELGARKSRDDSHRVTAL